MKNFRFYAEMPEERKSKSASKANPFRPWTVATLRDMAAIGSKCDVIAVHKNGESVGTAIAGNEYSYVWLSTYDRGYLRKRTTRIPEALARQLAPQLFARLGA